MGLFDKETGQGSRRGEYIENVGVLVVDDLKEHRELYREILFNDGYTKIHTAGNGSECLSILEAKGDEIFVVLLDRMLPDTTAAEIVRHLLNVHRNPVGIVINTAFPSAESKGEFSSVESENIYLTAYIDKADYDIDLISARVRNTAELIHRKRTELAAQNVEVAYESLRSTRVGLARVESQIRSGISNLSSRTPGLAASIGLGVVRALILALIIGVALKVDSIAEITAFLAKFID